MLDSATNISSRCTTHTRETASVVATVAIASQNHHLPPTTHSFTNYNVHHQHASAPHIISAPPRSSAYNLHLPCLKTIQIRAATTLNLAPYLHRHRLDLQPSLFEQQRSSRHCHLHLHCSCRNPNSGERKCTATCQHLIGQSTGQNWSNMVNWSME